MPSSTTIYVKLPDMRYPHPVQLGQYGPLDGLGLLETNFTVGYKIAPDGLLYGLATAIPRLVQFEAIDPVERIQMEHQRAEVGWADRNAGEYHPRFYKGGFHPAWDRRLPLTETKAAMLAEENLGVLDADLTDIARTVTPSPKTKDSFGSKISNVLAAACFEVEAQCMGILRANEYALPKRPSTEDYVKLCKPMRLDEYTLRLHRYRDYPEIQPFKGWTSNKGVRDAPGATQTLQWYEAYNKVKHDKEKYFELATLERAISAVAAIHVLLLAQYGATFHRQKTSNSFFILDKPAFWHHKERSYAPLDGEQWTSVPYDFGG